MEALIIAAGQGSRLSQFYSPKPLAPILGLRLLERIILETRRAGIRRFKIVVGYQAKKIMKEIGDGRKYGVEIEYIYNPEWQKGNGVSVYKAREHMKGKFLLLMADHIFEGAILEKLLKADVEPENCILCVDKNLQSDFFSLEDVTKVDYRGQYVKKIGKEISKFNAVDTGIFLCTPILFDALEESISRGEYSLSAGNQILAQRGQLQILDITGHFWVDVDNEAAVKKAKKILVQQLFKVTDGPISKTVNRPFSTRISAFLAQYNISPNMLTLSSFFMALMSAILFYFGTRWSILFAGIAAQLSSILDGCDGEIARLKFSFSSFGEWFDRILDRYADGLIVLGMTFAAWKTQPADLVWLLGFLAATGTFMNSYTAQPYDRLLKEKFTGGVSLRFGRDVRLFIIFVGALFNQVLLDLLVLAILTHFESIRRIFVLRYAYRLDKSA